MTLCIMKKSTVFSDVFLFFSELQEQYNDFLRPLICGNHHAPHLLKMWSSFYLTDIHQNLILEAYAHWLVKIKILGAQAWEEGSQYWPLHYYGHCIAVAVIVITIFPMSTSHTNAHVVEPSLYGRMTQSPKEPNLREHVHVRVTRVLRHDL
jgi:hypothetical protein